MTKGYDRKPSFYTYIVDYIKVLYLYAFFIFSVSYNINICNKTEISSLGDSSCSFIFLLSYTAFWNPERMHVAERYLFSRHSSDLLFILQLDEAPYDVTFPLARVVFHLLLDKQINGFLEPEAAEFEWSMEHSIDNWCQTHVTLNGVTCLYIKNIYMWLHVAAGAGNVLLQLSDMLDFEGTETLGNSILNYLQFACDFSP